MQIFRYVFTFLCIFTTLLMCVYWGYKFVLDEDLSVITYRRYHEKENDEYPTVSICLSDPFLRRPLEKHGVNESLYLKYLRGDYISEEMLKINYSNVTIDISEHIKGYRIYFRNGTTIKFDSKLSMKEKRMLTNNAFNGFGFGTPPRFTKCFSLNIPRVQELTKFRILLANSIFPHGYRPTYSGFTVVYHLHQQFLLAGENRKWVWPYRAANESYKMRIMVGSVTTMKRRYKQDYRCLDSYKEYDNWAIWHKKNETRCNMPYLEPDEKLSMCDTKELITRGLVNEQIVEKQRLDTPCKAMKVIHVEHLESSKIAPWGEQLGEFWFSWQFKEAEFKEIEQKRYCIRFIRKNISCNIL